MTMLAFVLIFAFLTLLHRSGRKALCPLIPIIVIIGWNGVAVYLFGIYYTVLTATMGAMTIGMVAEHCIMMVERIYEEMGSVIPRLQWSMEPARSERQLWCPTARRCAVFRHCCLRSFRSFRISVW